MKGSFFKIKLIIFNVKKLKIQSQYLVNPIGIFVALASIYFSSSVVTSAEEVEFKQIFTEVPRTIQDSLKMSFKKEAWPEWSAIVGSTLLFYNYDDRLYSWAQEQGRNWGLSNQDHTKTVLALGPYPILRLPSDTASALYFIGDGWTHGTIAAGLLGAGYFGQQRALRAGVQLVNGMVVSTLYSQIIKRSTGRESPSDRSTPRGRWRPFPNPKAYGKNTAKYDAFPSGHVMTTTLTITTLHLNYPEHSYWLLPVGGVALTALSFAMMNNGVHWISDYPLGIALGYVVAKAAYRIGNPAGEGETNSTTRSSNWLVFPSFDEASGVSTLQALKTF